MTEITLFTSNTWECRNDMCAKELPQGPCLRVITNMTEVYTGFSSIEHAYDFCVNHLGAPACWIEDVSEMDGKAWYLRRVNEHGEDDHKGEVHPFEEFLDEWWEYLPSTKTRVKLLNDY